MSVSWLRILGLMVVSVPRVFHGDIDEISLYNRPLTGAEIHAVYAAALPGNARTSPS